MLLTIGAIGQSRLLTEIQSTSAWQPVLNEALNEAQGQKFKAPVFLRHRACVLLFFGGTPTLSHCARSPCIVYQNFENKFLDWGRGPRKFCAS